MSKNVPKAIIEVQEVRPTALFDAFSNSMEHTMKNMDRNTDSHSQSQGSEKVYKDDNFATTETTTKCEHGTCQIQECVNGNCKEIQKDEKTGKVLTQANEQLDKKNKNETKNVTNSTEKALVQNKTESLA